MIDEDYYNLITNWLENVFPKVIYLRFDDHQELWEFGVVPLINDRFNLDSENEVYWELFDKIYDWFFNNSGRISDLIK
jgi:hypothetical protein